MMRRTDLMLFESAYGADTFDAKIGKPPGLVRVVHNGVTAAEFEAVEPAPEASDLVFVGELRALKGIDVLVDAIAQLAREWRKVSATIVGDGPDAAALKARVERLGLADTVRFVGVDAGARGVCTRPDPGRSLARGIPALYRARGGGRHVPMIATNVGGIPEIFGADAATLIPPGDASALAARDPRRPVGARRRAGLRLAAAHAGAARASRRP